MATARAFAAVGMSVAFCAGCTERLDVITPPPALAPREAGVVMEASVHVIDARGRGHDAAPPPVTDAVASPSHAVTDLQASYQDTCAVAAGTLYCWGKSPDGAAVLTPERVPGSAAGVFRRVSAGAAAHCATRSSGAVFCWGTNDNGQLGQGDRTSRAAPAHVALSGSAALVAGKFSSVCARLDDGQLDCWGDNTEGQMGQSDATASPTLALLPIRVEAANDWTSVGTGQGHVCGLRSPGVLYCWGRNTEGELGLGAVNTVQMRTPTLVPSGSDWLSVVGGQGHTCGIRAPGRLYCFGDGSAGQLGVEPRASSNVPVQVGDGADWRVVAIDTFHGCGIRGTGTLWCWGRNAEGQLGTGDITDRDVPTEVGDASNWADVSVGRFHTCARRTDGTAWCTGANDDGKLGTGDTDRRSVMTPVSWAL